MSKLSFDASKVEPQRPTDPIPAGWYPVHMTKSELKPTADGKGQRLAIELTVISGDFKGRKVFDGLNIKNPNAQAQEIGHQQLSAICHAVGVIKLTDSAQLHNKAFSAKVALEPERWVDKANNDVEPNTPGAKHYDAKNQCKGFKPLEDGEGDATPAASGKPAPGWVKPAAPAETPAEPTPPADPEPTGETEQLPGTREFFVVVEGKDDPVEMSEADLQTAINEGLDPESPVVVQGEDDWKTAGDYGITKVEAAPVKKTPPVPTKKAAPTPASTPAANPAGKGQAPWLKKKV